MKRMHGKQRRDERAPPEGTGHPREHEKQKQHIRCMKEQIGEMVAFRVESVKLIVHHVGCPGERMPIGTARRGERPRDGLSCQSGLDPAVLGDVLIVVVEDNEVVAEHLPIDSKG